MDLDNDKREFVKAAISASTLMLLAGSGLLLPKKVLAEWDKNAFDAATVEDALLGLLGNAEVVASDRIWFTVGSPPSYAINGAAVPIEVNSKIDNTERIIVLVDKNPNPLILSVDISPTMLLPIKTMIKVAEDSEVIAIVKADGCLYRTSRQISVDIGGCA